MIGLLVSYSLLAQPTSQIGRQSYSIKRLAERYHYDCPAFDDSLSTLIFENFIGSLDGGGYYFLKEDIDYLEQFRYSVDDDISAKTTSFFTETIQIYRTRLIAVDSLISLIKAESIDYEKEEVLSFREEDYPDHVSDYAALKERWRKWLKYSVLSELFDGDYFEDPVNTSSEEAMLRVIDAEKEIFKYYQFKIKAKLEHPAGYKVFLGTFYLDAIAQAVDPHTSYFSDLERESFIESLSGENLVFGFSLEEDEDGIIRIASLLPGSPAWNSPDLNQGDQLLMVQLSDGKELDAVTSTLEDISLFFANSKADGCTLIVKKKNGQVVEVELMKGEVYVEDDVIKNLILTGDKKVGYITLPDFYTDWDNETGLGCANDVAKTIVKLQKENIEGLILDLRYNGGGSVREAIDLAGIFIDWGPIGIMQGKEREPASIKDMNKGSIYDGPLVILVHSLSASASEILTAALQDYNRAIVVGSKTYGKATGQIILPLDPDFRIGMAGYDNADPEYGFLKITTSKYYRINKGTHQKTGIVPDVLIPDIYDLFDYGEAKYENAILPDSVQKKVYFTPFTDYSATLNANSKKRIQENPGFSRFLHLIDSLLMDETIEEEVNIGIRGFWKDAVAEELFYQYLFDLEISEETVFKAVNNQFDQEILKMDAYRRELNAEYLEEVEHDYYIQEAYQVIIDLIQLKN